MSYCTQTHLTEAYGERMMVQLTDRTQPGTGQVDAIVVDRALADTGALIDGYLAGRYSLPVASVPPLLTDIAIRIAIYKLHPRSAEDKIAADYRDAISTLKSIADGTVRLSIAGAEPQGSASAGAVRSNLDGADRLGPGSFGGYV